MSQLIRVAHVALQLETGGLERLLVEYARHVDRTRFLLEFICIGRRGVVADEIEAAGWRVRALDVPPGVRPGAVLRLARLLRASAIDVVHTHNTKPLLYAGPAAKLAGVRGVIHTRHGQRHGATKRQNLLFRWASRCADHVVCVSNDSTRCSQAEGLPARTLTVIPNGVDLVRFAGHGPITGGPALFVGRLTPEKDVPCLLRAAKRVIEQHATFALDIVGDGPCRSACEALAQTLGIADHVRFHGLVRDVERRFAAASCFVLASRTEGTPLTVLEAMSCGLPVVATSVGGVPDVVTDGVTGRLVPAGDEEALASALCGLAVDPEAARQMGQRGRERALAHFDVRAMVRSYEGLYDSIQARCEARAA